MKQSFQKTNKNKNTTLPISDQTELRSKPSIYRKQRRQKNKLSDITEITQQNPDYGKHKTKNMVCPTNKFQVKGGGENLQIKKDLRDIATNCNVWTFLDPDSNKYCIKQTL